jgi:hypothetical protein
MVKLLRDAARSVARFDRDPGAAAHFIRTRAKRLQSLCRLVPRGRAWRESILPACRGLKDVFAETRDAMIVESLAARYAPGQSRHLRVSARPDLVRAAQLIETAAAALSAYADWGSVRAPQVADRAVGTYRAARRAWREAARRRAPDAAFHDWRRRVKRLLYQCEHLDGAARAGRFSRRLDRLGEVLGGIQDVCLAEEWFARHADLRVPADLARSKVALRRRALRQAEPLLGPKPREFRARLA